MDIIYQWGDGLFAASMVPEILLADLDDRKVDEIACGRGHSMCVTSDGQVYTWGDNRGGQLGLGHAVSQLDPALFSFVDDEAHRKIKTIDCGTDNSCALDVEGNVKLAIFDLNVSVNPR